MAYAGARARDRPRSVKLAGVKHDLYHPNLPTLRKMDMDNVTHKLSTEHCRTTTPTPRDVFESSRTAKFAWGEDERKRRLHCLNYLGTDTRLALCKSKSLDLGQHTRNWMEVLQKLNTFQQQPKEEDTVDEAQQEDGPIGGYTARLERPGFAQSWQMFSRHRFQFTRPRPATVAVARLY